MAITPVPAGFGLILVRSRENAIAALKAADDAGLAQSVVRTVDDGYLVPTAVFEKYQAAVEEPAEAESTEAAPAEAEAEKPAAKKSPAKKATTPDESPSE